MPQYWRSRYRQIGSIRSTDELMRLTIDNVLPLINGFGLRFKSDAYVLLKAKLFQETLGVVVQDEPATEYQAFKLGLIDANEFSLAEDRKRADSNTIIEKKARYLSFLALKAEFEPETPRI